MVAPLIAAFEAATMVKSLPVIPSNTSLATRSVSLDVRQTGDLHDADFLILKLWRMYDLERGSKPRVGALCLNGRATIGERSLETPNGR